MDLAFGASEGAELCVGADERAAKAAGGADGAVAPTPWARWSPALGAAIVARIAAGERLAEICRERDMPTRATVKYWRRQRPDFGRQVDWAFRTCRAAVKGGARSGYHPAVAALICGRLVEGEPLTRICRDAGMPSIVTVYYWLRRHPEFAEAYAQARELQGHVKFDLIAEEADRATPATARLAQVRIDALRWQAARLAPKAYGVRSETQIAPELRAAMRAAILLERQAERTAAAAAAQIG
jgi:transposase-like protein